jgi:hypothetical protein
MSTVVGRKPDAHIEAAHLKQVWMRRSLLPSGTRMPSGQPGSAQLPSGSAFVARVWRGPEIVDMTFDPREELIFRTADGESAERLTLRGISITDLTGEMGPLLNLDQFRLTLPFTWEQCRVIRFVRLSEVRFNEIQHDPIRHGYLVGNSGLHCVCDATTRGYRRIAALRKNSTNPGGLLNQPSREVNQFVLRPGTWFTKGPFDTTVNAASAQGTGKQSPSAATSYAPAHA